MSRKFEYTRIPWEDDFILDIAPGTPLPNHCLWCGMWGTSPVHLPACPMWDDLCTTTELKVLAIAGKGYSSKRVASVLGISVRTVEVHIRHLYEKLHISCRDELIDYSAIRNHGGNR